MVGVNIFQKFVKGQGQGKNHDTMWKVLSQGIHMCNMNNESPNELSSYGQG